MKWSLLEWRVIAGTTGQWGKAWFDWPPRSHKEHLGALFSTRLVGSADGCERWAKGQNHCVAGETKWFEVKSSLQKQKHQQPLRPRRELLAIALCVFTGIFELRFIRALILCMFVVEFWKSEIHKTIKRRVSKSSIIYTNSEPIKTARVQEFTQTCKCSSPMDLTSVHTASIHTWTHRPAHTLKNNIVGVQRSMEYSSFVVWCTIGIYTHSDRQLLLNANMCICKRTPCGNAAACKNKNALQCPFCWDININTASLK